MMKLYKSKSLTAIIISHSLDLISRRTATTVNYYFCFTLCYVIAALKIFYNQCSKFAE